MVTETLEKPLSYEEERGKPMPSENHAAIQINLGVEFARHREFRTYSELTLEFEGKTYTPDLSVYPRKALDLRHDQIRRTDPPLLVVEIFSPRQGYQDVMEKVDVYFRNGVKSCWIVSPPIHTITILGADGREEHHHSGVAKDPVTGLTADLEAVFS
ncbi:MAG: Uma2 family endonuclease [Verrucomicrobia bacterium]|nr:Uma2 family endonuclease [Verrucomicrobiota bacterium]